MLALNPAIGEVDVALATELLEAGRMIFNGFVTPDRTTLIASTHRVLAIGERAAMGDGSFDVGRLLRAVKERSKAQILFDMDQAAEESGGVINAVLLGALAGSGKLPIPDAAFEAAIREGGKAVDTNLAAFAFGRGHARGELEQAVREHRKRQAAAQGVEDLIERARRDFPAASLDIVEEGIRRLAAYQDRRYAALYPRPPATGRSTRPSCVREVGAASRGAHVVRGRDPRGAGQDLARAAGRGCAPRCAPSRTSRSRSPSISSPATRRSRRSCRPGWRGWLLAARRPVRTISMHVRSTTVWGFARLRLLAGLRWWRPHTWRYVEEQAEIERWLAQIRAARRSASTWRARSPNAARLIKGYGDTYKRGLGNYRRISRRDDRAGAGGPHGAAGGRRCRRQRARRGPRRSRRRMRSSGPWRRSPRRHDAAASCR